GIIRDITQQKEVEKEKSEFISTVSHELRTPLTSIRASLGMLASGSMGALPEKASRLTTIAKQNTERLIILVNDILDIEKLQAGKIAFQFKGLILADLVSACLQVNQSLAEKYAIRFELQAGHDKTCVMADQSRLMQVVNNLLSNAAKYSPAGGVVTIAISHTEQRVRVTVMDRGPGVPNAFRKQIFGRFKQADSSDTRKVGGTGLGLSISQSIIQRHGGHMGFDSIEGEGASFYFELAAKPDAAPHAHDETQQISVPTPSAPRILLVGDDAAVAKLLSEMLQQAGFATDTAHTARQARQYLMHTHYDAMTVDIMLPDQDGISLIRDIRLQEKTRHLATVVIAAKAQPARQQVHLSCLGIVDWIEKPFNKALLIDAIKLALQPAKASKKQLQDVSLAASLLKSNIRKNLIRLDSLGTST
ncbi:MAG: ATP-binding protein, partial [Bermanella sp.]